MNKEEEQTLTLLVKNLIKHTYKDAKPEYLSWLEDDFRTEFINDYCNRKINEWSWYEENTSDKLIDTYA